MDLLLQSRKTIYFLAQLHFAVQDQCTLFSLLLFLYSFFFFSSFCSHSFLDFIRYFAKIYGPLTPIKKNNLLFKCHHTFHYARLDDSFSFPFLPFSFSFFLFDSNRYFTKIYGSFTPIKKNNYFLNATTLFTSEANYSFPMFLLFFFFFF